MSIVGQQVATFLLKEAKPSKEGPRATSEDCQGFRQSPSWMMSSTSAVVVSGRARYVPNTLARSALAYWAKARLAPVRTFAQVGEYELDTLLDLRQSRELGGEDCALNAVLGDGAGERLTFTGLLVLTDIGTGTYLCTFQQSSRARPVSDFDFTKVRSSTARTACKITTSYKVTYKVRSSFFLPPSSHFSRSSAATSLIVTTTTTSKSTMDSTAAHPTTTAAAAAASTKAERARTLVVANSAAIVSGALVASLAAWIAMEGRAKAGEQLIGDVKALGYGIKAIYDWTSVDDLIAFVHKVGELLEHTRPALETAAEALDKLRIVKEKIAAINAAGGEGAGGEGEAWALAAGT
ncbi:hypothetical protein CALVIDRAFT_569444 [Calocera viscosa TUFC12733]|uniref:Uncharacterized protein n=1 Tax=Calocera viscosa (strain TUFC12733) TaxID=1330018 RepID=A0A167FZV6_CALVF|nr:hypothetical protein CALVIDRAFT_569444 [Calocera viscosa TUFC12733]